MQDYFTPWNEGSLDASDQDLGSGGIAILPDQSGPNSHLLVQVGKGGSIRVVNRDNMSHFNSSGDNIVQEFTGVGGMYASPIYFNGKVYFWGSGDVVKAFTVTNGMLSTSPTDKGNFVFGFPGATPIISANGTSNAILWALEEDAFVDNGVGGPAVLYAYDPSHLSAGSLYNSNQNSSRDNPGGAIKFAVPTVANGKVYVGADEQLTVFGELVSAGGIAPSITSANSATFAVGTPGSFTVTATGSPTPSLTESGALPSGVTFTNHGNGTATLSGTPASGTGGKYSLTFTASNGVGMAATQSFTLTVSQAPAIASLSTTSGAVGTAVTITGTNFGSSQGTSTVTFNGTAATVTGWSATSIVTSVPAGATTGNVVVTVGGVASNAVIFTVTGLGPLLSISPTSITFPSQYVGGSGVPQNITVTNSGTAALNITVSISPSDFVLQSACGGSLAGGSSCSLSVSFKPTVSGARPGTLTITDTADSPQTVALSGVGEDFSIAATSPSTVNVTAGQTANYTLAVLPSGGFNQAVALTCSGAPTLSVCNVSPSSVSLNGTSSTAITVTITTMAPAKGILPLFRFGPSSIKYEPLALTGLAVGFGAFITVLLWCPKQRFPRAHAIATTILLAATLLVSSCGGGAHPSTSAAGSPGTQAGSYTISVSASFTSGSAALNHNTSLKLTVQ